MDTREGLEVDACRWDVLYNLCDGFSTFCGESLFVYCEFIRELG